MKLLEVVRGAETGKDVLATVMGLAEAIKKTAVVSGVCDGFIGNRMLEPYLRQSLFLLEEGALPAQVDRALEDVGHGHGAVPDVRPGRQRHRLAHPQAALRRAPGRASAPCIADRLCEQGRFGQKTGAGWYRYEAGRRDALPDPAVDEMITAYRREKGISRRGPSRTTRSSTAASSRS